MKKMSKKGFTLVELMVVVIIVGILAAVAVPLMTANTDKAKNSEAVAALGAINTAARLYGVEYTNNTTPTISQLSAAGYLNLGDLTSGTYVTATNAFGALTYTGGKVSGTVSIDGTTWTFTWDTASKSYKATK